MFPARTAGWSPTVAGLHEADTGLFIGCMVTARHERSPTFPGATAGRSASVEPLTRSRGDGKNRYATYRTICSLLKQHPGSETVEAKLQESIVPGVRPNGPNREGRGTILRPIRRGSLA